MVNTHIYQLAIYARNICNDVDLGYIHIWILSRIVRFKKENVSTYADQSARPRVSQGPEYDGAVSCGYDANHDNDRRIALRVTPPPPRGRNVLSVWIRSYHADVLYVQFVKPRKRMTLVQNHPTSTNLSPVVLFPRLFRVRVVESARALPDVSFWEKQK